MKILIESFDFPRVKVCYVEKIVTIADAERCAFVNGVVAPVAVIDGDDGVRLVQRRAPSRDGTIFTDKDENRGSRSSILGDLEEPGIVKHGAGWIGAF